MDQKVLENVSSLVKRASDRKIFHIEDIILSMNEIQPIILFSEPIDINCMFEENENHKKEMGKLIIYIFLSKFAHCQFIHFLIFNQFFFRTNFKG